MSNFVFKIEVHAHVRGQLVKTFYTNNRDRALNYMNAMEYSDRVERCVHVTRADPRDGRLVFKNYPNPYAIGNYDDWFKVEDMYEARDPLWRIVYNRVRKF